MRIGKRYEMRYLPADMACIREYATTKTASGGARRWRELVSIMRRHGDLHYPPGMFVYGLDTFYPRMSALITGVFRGPFYRFGIRLNRVFTRVVFFLSYRLARYTQGIHPDGWATRSAFLWFPNRGDGRLILDIECPDWPQLAGQRLRVSAGSRLQVLALSPGLERYTIDVPAPASASEPIKLRLDATRWVPESAPRRYRRDLAYLLRAARFEPAT
jgi:hypothetical protein